MHLSTASCEASEIDDEQAKVADVPITFLSGFLGAGKTTLLEHVLENKQGLKVGLIVNDVAEINIDAALINITRTGTNTRADIIELANGCACCTSANDLVQAIQDLMSLSRERGDPWDHIVVELSGVAEPQEVRRVFDMAAQYTPERVAGTALHTVATVVDASTFLDFFHDCSKVDKGSDLGTSSVMKPVGVLLVEQIESADVLVINKTDLVDSKTLTLLQDTLRELNADAALHCTERGRADLTEVLAAATSQRPWNELFDFPRAVELVERKHTEKSPANPEHQNDHHHKHDHHHYCTHPDHDHDHDHDHHHHHHHDHGHGHEHESPGQREAKRFGITSFVYQRRRPFDQAKLEAALKQLPQRRDHQALAKALNEPEPRGQTTDLPQEESPLRRVLRSKGFVWLHSSNEVLYYWAHAGNEFELRPLCYWWSCVPRAQWPNRETEVKTIERAFGESEQDQRQELVFIGVDMDEAAITQLLDACLFDDPTCSNPSSAA